MRISNPFSHYQSRDACWRSDISPMRALSRRVQVRCVCVTTSILAAYVRNCESSNSAVSCRSLNQKVRRFPVDSKVLASAFHVKSRSIAATLCRIICVSPVGSTSSKCKFRSVFGAPKWLSFQNGGFPSTNWPNSGLKIGNSVLSCISTVLKNFA